MRCEDVIAIVKEYERLIKSQGQNIICLAYRQVSIFNKFKKSGQLPKIMKELGISKPTVINKINLYN